MTSPSPLTTRPGVPPPLQTQAHSAQPTPTQTASQNKKTCQSAVASRPRPVHTQSAPTISSTNAKSATSASNVAFQGSPQLHESVSSPAESTQTLERSTAARGYTTHLPHNPNRPPPLTYQRQHEFPPFPPLTQHPVLPFLTTAFSNHQEPHQVPSPFTKPRPPIAPRASTTQRHVHSTVSTIPTMDVSKNDPTATFIRPPLVVPLSRNADPNIDPSMLDNAGTNGAPAPGTALTYAILHAHRNWFLDADDFCKDNPNRIHYPPELEPPRGWAPLNECTGAGAANRCKQAKENKERTYAVRTKGSYAHADNALTDTTIEYGPSDDCHEKTVLRCTFCRREYHGPNAKSMWRRHVYDKHKVAMKNRREGSAGMAPKSSLPKKGKFKVAGPSNIASLAPPATLDSPAQTSILTNEENLIRLLHRVVNGNLNISLPVSLLNPSPSSDGATPALNLQTIALALQKSGISLAVEKGTVSGSLSYTTIPFDRESSADRSDTATSLNGKPPQEGDQETRGVSSPTNSSSSATETQDFSPLHSGPSPAVVDEVARAIWIDDPETLVSNPSISTRHPTGSARLVSSLKPDVATHGQKRKAEDAVRDVEAHTYSLWDRTPLKDNTALDRNNHNSNTQATPGTPRKDKGKQRALPSSPGAPRMPQATSPVSSPTQNPYTPLRHLSTTALRSRALATTGEESYLTLVVSSPATASPLRSTGRISFTSPFSRRTSPRKGGHRDNTPTSDDILGALGATSPRYPFDFNIRATQSSPSYMSAFDPIPLEMGGLSPAHWSPPSLGPPAPVSEPTSRSISRASSIVDDFEADDKEAVTEDDQRLELEYPEWSSPSQRSQSHGPSEGAKVYDDDFDMDDFLDLEDAGPALDSDLTPSPQKIVAGRGFSKEFGLLSPDEVDRITASVRPTFEDEARSSKRRKVDCSS